MQVSEGMSSLVLTIGPGHTLRDAARAMAERKSRRRGRDRPRAAGAGDRDRARPPRLDRRRAEPRHRASCADHLSANLTFAEPSWSLERAAEAMVRGGFRHLVVVDGGETVGVLSMRDIVRCWTGVGATCEVPA